MGTEAGRVGIGAEGNDGNRHVGGRSVFLAGVGGAVAGVVMLVGVLLAPGGPPEPTAAAAGSAPTGPDPSITGTTTAPSPAPTRTTRAPRSTPTPRSAPSPTPSSITQAPRPAPVTLKIPSLHVSTTIIGVGLNPDRTPEVPPLTPAGIREVGWYDLGPAPGQAGPAVIVGHVDGAKGGRGSFYSLGTLVPGRAISVTLANGRSAHFSVTSVREYPTAHFPVRTVYGPGSATSPSLRLITCGGRFDRTTNSYLSNIVVYAKKT